MVQVTGGQCLGDLTPPPRLPGDEAECLYVVISGRLRLLHEARHTVTGQLQLHTEEEVGRGEAVGAVWAISGEGGGSGGGAGC